MEEYIKGILLTDLPTAKEEPEVFGPGRDKGSSSPAAGGDSTGAQSSEVQPPLKRVARSA